MSDVVESNAQESGESHESDVQVEIEVITPIIVDLGKIKPKRVKRLKKGSGPLVDEVFDVLDELTEALEGELDDKTIVPVVMLYEKKKKKRKRRRIVLPF